MLRWALLSSTQASPPTPDIPSLIIERHAQKLAVLNPATITALEKILREQTRRCIPETREFFTFPALHQNVAEAVLSEIPSIWFQTDIDDDDFDDDICTHIMGVYICSNSTCRRQLWVSKMVPIEIRGYDGDGYSAIVYNERCMSCNRLGTFVLDENSYVERVAYRIKKWAGVVMGLPFYERRTGSPHKQEFCEGCRRGKCKEMDRYVCY